MRISELSAASGVTIPTIKFYLREGLLEPGERRGVNQADYGEAHLARLRLIRALREVAGLGLGPIAEVLEACSASPGAQRAAAGRAIDALGIAAPVMGVTEQKLAAARDEVVAVLRGRGWRFRRDAAAIDTLARAMLAARETFETGLSAEDLGCYADAMLRVAYDELEVASPEHARTPEGALRTAVLGTVLFEPVILALRRLAFEHLTMGERS